MTVAARWRGLILPGVLTLLVLAVLLSLSAWQFSRMGWKEALLARIEARIDAAPVPVPPEADWPAWRADEDEYRRVMVEGRFLHDREVLVHGNTPRDERGRVFAGYYVLTPLARPDGSIVVVNRGFVPLENRDPATRAPGQVEGEVVVSGVMRAPQERGWFLPADDPAKGEWFTRDPAAIAAAFGLTRVAPFMVEADGASNPGGLPRGGLTRVSFPNNHLEYALTWLGLAIGLLGVFAAFATRRLKGAA